MASIADIRHHMRVVSQTLQITKAMQMISTSKMKKGLARYDATAIYLQEVRQTIKDVLMHAEGQSHRYLQVAVRLALRMHQDVLDGLAHFLEVDGGGVIARQTLFHLGGGDHLHGLCDLQRLRDHAHVVADIGYARHVLLTS